MVTHLEPDIPECEVRWVLGRITTSKASGGDRIPVELFQILKDDAVKVLHSVYQQIWKIQQHHKTGKDQSLFQSQGQSYCTVVLIWHSSKVVFKIRQDRLQQYVNQELPNVQAPFRRGRGTRDQIANTCWIMEKARESQKNIYCFINYT